MFPAFIKKIKTLKNLLVIMKCFLFLALIVFAAVSTSFAQTSVSTDNNYNLLELNNENWSFFSDENSDVMYIDFAKLTFNLSDIVVLDENGEVLFKDDVLDLPVDSIYELDLSDYKSGKYDVELRSFTGNVTKEITVK
jgi:hypothetical protein